VKAIVGFSIAVILSSCTAEASNTNKTVSLAPQSTPSTLLFPNANWVRIGIVDEGPLYVDSGSVESQDSPSFGKNDVKHFREQLQLSTPNADGASFIVSKLRKDSGRGLDREPFSSSLAV